MYPHVVKEERTNATVPGGPVILEISVVAENIFVTFLPLIIYSEGPGSIW